MPIYYRNISTGEIEAKYIGCDTASSKFRNEANYERFETPENLDVQIEPIPSPNPNQDVIDALENAETDKDILNAIQTFVERKLE